MCLLMGMITLLQGSDWRAGLLPQDGMSSEELLASRCPDAEQLQGLTDLLGCMLDSDPNNRPSAQQLLQHSWLQ